MKVVTFGKLKGGVGATTLAYLFGNKLAESGSKVLMIDLDHQLNLTHLFNAYDNHKTIKGAFMGEKLDGHLKEVGENLYLISGSFGLDELEVTLSVDDNRNKLLYAWFYHNREQLGQFDYVILDTRPEFTTVVKNAIMCSDYIVCPLTPSEFSYTSKDNIEYRLEKFRDSFLDFRTGKSDVIAELIYVGNLIERDKAGEVFLEKTAGKTVANFPKRALLNRSISDKKPLHELKKISRVKSDNKELFDVLDVEFDKLRRKIDKGE